MQLQVRAETEEAMRALRQVPDALARAVVRWEERGAPYVAREYALEIRRQQRGFGGTGELAGSVRVQRLGVGTFSVGPEAKHAPFFIHGTRPHEIRPRNAKALVFAASGGGVARLGMNQQGQAFTVLAVQGPLRPGQRSRTRRISAVVFSQGVHHPGTSPHNVLGPLAEQVERPLARILEEEVQRELARIAGEALRGVFG